MSGEKKTSGGGLGRKLMLSGALILGSGAYAWWQHEPDGETKLALAQSATAPDLPKKTENLPPDATAPSVTPPEPGSPAPRIAMAPSRPVFERHSMAPVPDGALPDAADQPAPPPPFTSNIPPAQIAGPYADGQFDGQAADTAWGDVQVRVTIRGAAIATVEPIVYPDHRRRSIQINEWALPMLAQEVIRAQSTNVDIVSQATTTSIGYLQSLATALAKAKKQP